MLDERSFVFINNMLRDTTEIKRESMANVKPILAVGQNILCNFFHIPGKNPYVRIGFTA